MRRRLLTVLLAGALLPAGLAGCGIPDRTEVQVDGRGPAVESGSLNGSGGQPPTRSATEDPKEFIREYLAAAAGEREQAYDRVKKFIAKEAQGRLRKKQSSEVELTVVRLLESPETTLLTNQGTWQVTVRAQQVGVLRADGTLEEPAGRDVEYKFKLRRADPGTQGLLITDLPNVLLLTDEALRQYYGTYTVYFWNSDQSQLVPDWRYLPSAVPAERRVTEVVRWLTGGPSEWLASGVTKVPDGTGLINNVTGSDDRWEVNLTMPAAYDDRLAKLATQLAWSLQELTGQLDLKIQNQQRRTVDLGQEREAHPLYPNLRTPERFCVYGGAIHPLAIGNEPVGAVPVAAADNRNVVSAALSRAGDEVLAALVTRSDQKQRLQVGSGRGEVTVDNRSSRLFRSIGRPVWLRSADVQHPSGLVVADGTLYRFDGAAGMSPVDDLSGPVTAVAASLDGHRIALIMSGELYVAPVSADGGVVTVGKPRRLATRLTKLTAVDWYAENYLVFAGNDGRQPAIYQTTVDGAVQFPLNSDTGAPVSHLAAFPGGSSGALPSYSFMYQATRAYRNNPFTEIERAQVRDVAAGAKPSDPSAPFFLY
ncbi:LpqB family beta-propeller domain-containing protein [Micromonospora soli]|uniref:LpqB family beta-propeller domain-containing protein n=1 Tax=Micromonospora sp. NBRC 110009 TaxID=3061627 RepID=UPI0026715A7D|nr:LpqB family beta-propeller domain-containing protein [Micromonospora sp. NBRC 110009]WKU00036.1 LpqB family beta-propeller domain-containing protein [Micromonospora sp. NBRC 110009]